jgi:hypothetical protein
MTKYPCAFLLVIAAFATLIAGCAGPQQAFYVSPFNGNNTEYHTIPKRGDSVHKALYGSVSFFKATANTNNVDDLWGVHASIYAAHQYDFVQFYYGASLSLGSYNMGQWAYAPSVPSSYLSSYSTSNSYYANTDQLNTYTGGYTFGGLGFQGGINAVVPIGIGEWRLLGVETSVIHEFGNYLSLRRQMPDSIATLINRSSLFATVGIYSELIGHVREGEFGFRWAYGTALGHAYSDPGIEDNDTGSPLRYLYFNFSFHYTYHRMTAYVMINQATKVTGEQAGINYRLTR